jgi:hypothetical protein
VSQLDDAKRDEDLEVGIRTVQAFSPPEVRGNGRVEDRGPDGDRSLGAGRPAMHPRGSASERPCSGKTWRDYLAAPVLTDQLQDKGGHGAGGVVR